MILIDTTYLPQIVLEGIIGTLFLIFWIDSVRRARIKKHIIAKRLAQFLGIYLIATIFTTLNQINREVLEFSLIPKDSAIFFDQLYKAFAFAANYWFFLFYLEVFTHYEKPPKKKVQLLIFTIISIGATLSLPLLPQNIIDVGDTIISVLLLVHSLVIYIPLFIQSRALYHKIDEDNERRPAVFSIFLTSAFFILLWIVNILNQVWDMLTDKLYGPFWLFSWIVIFLAIFSAYAGFINPPWLRKLLKKFNRGNNKDEETK